MTEAELIARQAKQLEELRDEVAELKDRARRALLHIYRIRSPLNDNSLRYSRPQMEKFAAIANELCPAPEYPLDLLDLRCELIIREHDRGTIEHRIEMFKTNRRDCYRIVADGVEWKRRMGWSKALEAVRKSLVRVGQHS